MSLNRTSRSNRRVLTVESLESRQLLHGGPLTMDADPLGAGATEQNTIVATMESAKLELTFGDSVSVSVPSATQFIHDAMRTGDLEGRHEFATLLAEQLADACEAAECDSTELLTGFLADSGEKNPDPAETVKNADNYFEFAYKAVMAIHDTLAGAGDSSGKADAQVTNDNDKDNDGTHDSNGTGGPQEGQKESWWDMFSNWGSAANVETVSD